MKNTIFVLMMLAANTLFAQNSWFKTYTDSVALLNDASQITKQFTADIKKIQPDTNLNVKLLLHTTPNLIYIDHDTVHLPLYSQVIPPLKEFLAQLSGSPENAEEAFGLFFNGFYLPHELGHGFQFTVENYRDLTAYDMEHFANTVSMLWWRKHNRNKELKRCYDYAKKITKDYPNPFPEGIDKKKYFSENYQKIINDRELFAKIYPYVQFNQFIELYEDKSLPNFDKFIKNYIANNKK